MFRQKIAASCIVFLLSIPAIFVFVWKADGHGTKSHDKLISISAEKLPGVTWADDIHPIFIRNKCYNCHTRGDEDMVEGLAEFALGMIDPKDPGNSYFSFHELVYTEGAANKIEGEVLRDGQCCWPRRFSAEQQRRIWLGFPERSVLLRKLDRDYYDWNEPPRYLEEGLRLSWGLPMPMWDPDGEEGVEKKKTKKKELHSPSLWREILVRMKLIAGRGQKDLSDLPLLIPAGDRALIRQWISNATQIRDEGTKLSVTLKGGKNNQIKNRNVRFIGNYVTFDQKSIEEVFDLKSDDKGIARLEFSKDSVVSLVWNIGVQSGHDRYKYKEVTIKPGISNNISIDL